MFLKEQRIGSMVYNTFPFGPANDQESRIKVKTYPSRQNCRKSSL